MVEGPNMFSLYGDLVTTGTSLGSSNPIAYDTLQAYTILPSV